MWTGNVEIVIVLTDNKVVRKICTIIRIMIQKILS